VNTVKLYSDPSFKPAGTDHPVLLSRFDGFGDAVANHSPRYSAYMRNPNLIFELTSLEEADFAVLPVIWEDIETDYAKQQAALKFLETPKQAGKKVVIFFRGDSDQPIPLENTLIFRTSLKRSTMQENDAAMPAIVEDFVARYLNDTLQIRHKRDRARVGFCGTSFFSNSLKDHLRKTAVKTGLRDPLPTAPREDALKNILKSKLVEPNIVLREQSWWSDDPERKKIRRREYVQNIVDSDYTLAVRGVGNFSWRFYETLSTGRIPVFVNTDCVLPFEDHIDWKQYCMWVEQHEIAHIDEKIADFHNDISHDHFTDLQVECRKLWKEWLSAEGFYAHFYEHPQLLGYATDS